MSRLLHITGAMALLLFVGGTLLLAAAPKDVPPFTVTAKKMSMSLNKAAKLVYSGNVRFTSPKYTTSITCDSLEANGTNLKAVTSVHASGGVEFSGIIAGDSAEAPTYKVFGKSELAVYDMANARVVKLLKVKGVQPMVTVITVENGVAGEPATISGNTIVINMDEGTVDVEDVAMEKKEGAQ